MRLRERSVLGSLGVLAVVYGLLAIPWPGLGHAFVSAYAGVAQATLAPALPFDGTTFRATAPGEQASEWDLAIRLPAAPGATDVHGIRVHVRRIAYIPLAFLVAFTLAFPPARGLPWWRIVACPLALGALQGVALLSVFTTRGLLDLGLPVDVLVGLVSRAFFEAPGMGFAVPALLWIWLARPFSTFRLPVNTA